MKRNHFLHNIVIAGLMACLPLSAEHGGTRAFDELTNRWHSESKVKVLDHKVNYGWSEDSAIFYFKNDTSGDATSGINIADGKPVATTKTKGLLKENGSKAEGAGRIADAGKRSWKSPQGNWQVQIKEGAVLLSDKNGKSRQLAKPEKDHRFEAEPLWNPDGTAFVIWHCPIKPKRQVTYVRSSPKDQLQPQTFTQTYPKPGDELAIGMPWIFPVEGSAFPVDPALVADAFNVHQGAWRADSQRFIFHYIERGFGKHRIVEMDIAKRKQRILIDESSETFVSVFGYGFRHDLDGGNEILWTSELDGWNHLYLMDGLTGKIKKQLTCGDWVVKKVLRVEEKKHRALLEICGYFPTQDPYFDHYAMVDLRSGTLTPLTRSSGQHDAPIFSPDGMTYVCKWSRIDHPPVYELRRTEDGSMIAEFARADATALLKKWKMPMPFVAKDREGKHDIHGIVILPPDFDPAKSYPVIENIYAGPHDAFVPKAWAPWLAPMHEIAVHGFIVVKMDGRGTAHRGKAFHNHCYKNIKDAGFPDRIAWMRELTKKIPQMDLARVGIFGGSAGGQSSTGALLFHGDFYKAAVSDCGCHDNRMDKIWWNEQWMDWPIGPHYAENSNVVNAHKLQGALMLTVGEVDTNVDPASTLQVVNALLKADKDFECIIVPNGGHGVGESRNMQRRRVDFFIKHLGGPKSY